MDQTAFFQSTLHPNSLLQQKGKDAAYQTPAEPSQDPCEWECVFLPAIEFLELFVIRPYRSKSWLIYLSNSRWEALTQPQRSQSPHHGPHQSRPLRSWAGWGCCHSQEAGLSWWLPWTWVQPAGTRQSGAETIAAAGIETPGTSETRSYKCYWRKAAQENRIPGWHGNAFLPASWRAWQPLGCHFSTRSILAMLFQTVSCPHHWGHPYAPLPFRFLQHLSLYNMPDEFLIHHVLLFSVCLPQLEHKLHQGKGCCLFCSWMHIKPRTVSGT